MFDDVPETRKMNEMAVFKLLRACCSATRSVFDRHVLPGLAVALCASAFVSLRHDQPARYSLSSLRCEIAGLPS